MIGSIHNQHNLEGGRVVLKPRVLFHKGGGGGGGGGGVTE